MHYRFAEVLILLSSVCIACSASAQTQSTPQFNTAILSGGKEEGVTEEAIGGKRFRFSWKTDGNSGENGTAVLRKDGTIAGIPSPNERFWRVDDRQRLIFSAQDGSISTIFTKAEQRDGKWFFSGPFQFDVDVLHQLEEIAPAAIIASKEDLINQVVRRYSKQRIVALNPGEAYRFALNGGSTRTIRLVSVNERRDSVVGLLRRAEVRVEIDGQPLDLVCAPYVMPTETAGLRLQADTMTGWTNMPKRVQFSIWDARDPIVDTSRFRYPIKDFRLFSHDMQAFNEPLHVGLGDGDPEGLKGYHNYGVDLAGFDGGEEIVSATEGDVVRFWPSGKDVCSVTVRDASGFLWGYVHLSSFAPQVALGTHVSLGQKLGVLGKTGPSGNFSHLHFGSYIADGDPATNSPKRNEKLNLYPWLVTAYQAERPKEPLAVARPHHVVLTGEKEVFDGSNSLAFGGRRIVDWRWVFQDGRTVHEAKAEKSFDRPGTFVATLWVKDDQGAEDVDFCQVKVFSRRNQENAMPHIFMTHTPTENIRPGQPVRFRFWFQGNGGGPMTVDFDGGTRVNDYRSYSDLVHRFDKGGIHIVTARCVAAGAPITQKIKVVVLPEP